VVRDAGMAGILTVAVAAGEGRLQVEVIAPGGPAPHTRARVETIAADGRRGHPQLGSCGDGCLAGPWPAPAGLSSVRVDASAPGWRGGTFTATVSWPPAPADPALLARVADTMRGEPSVEMTERTSSGPDSRADPATFTGTGAELMDNAPYAAGVAQDVRPLSGGDGLSLYLSGDRIWATLQLDDRGRLASEHIIDVGHLIDRTFAYPG
ncbi:MAG: hypothetical protein M3011_08180, partial [Actinomycetota bacterium]|nr:hypothetical protein [Actinomycetota bacterium]